MCAFLIAIAIMLLLVLVLFSPVTIRIHFSLQDGERSFDWHVGLLKNLIRRDYHFAPKETFETLIKRRGRKGFYELIFRFLRGMSFWQVDAYFLIGFGDAALTAVCCGLWDASLNTLGRILLPRPRRGRGLCSATTPGYGDSAFAFEAQINGIFRTRLAQIIPAALLWLRVQIKERHR